MANTKISNATAQAMLTQLATSLNSGILRIYDGAQPTDVDTAIGAQTLLAELTINATAFVISDAAPGALATANAITGDTSANATGTAAWFRAFQTDGTTAVIDGDVSATAGGGDLELDNTSIDASDTVNVTGWTITMPEG